MSCKTSIGPKDLSTFRISNTAVLLIDDPHFFFGL
jgi:hypothetical protein